MHTWLLPTGPSFRNIKVNIEQGQKLSWDEPTTGLPTININGAVEHFAPIQVRSGAAACFMYASVQVFDCPPSPSTAQSGNLKLM